MTYPASTTIAIRVNTAAIRQAATADPGQGGHSVTEDHADGRLGPAETELVTEIRRRREAAGLSQAKLATLTGYSHEYVSRAERTGRGLASVNVIQAIDKALAAGGELVSLRARADAERTVRRSSTQRSVARKTLQSSGTNHILDGSAPVQSRHPDTGDLLGVELFELAAAMQPNSVNARMLDYEDELVHRIHREFAAAAPTTMSPIVGQHLRTVTQLLKVGQPAAVRRRLCSIAGHLAGLRAWLLFDMRAIAFAESWFKFALAPATEAEDDALAAWILGGRSVVAFDCGDASKASRLIDRARTHVVRLNNHDPVCGWISGLGARVNAKLGRTAPAREAIEQCRRRDWMTSSSTYRHGMDTKNDRLVLDYYEGGSLLAVGDATRARAAFEVAAASLGPERLKGRAIINLNIAITFALEGEIEHAASLGMMAWNIPEDLRIGPIRERVWQLRDLLSAAHPQLNCVAALSEMLAEPDHN